MHKKLKPIRPFLWICIFIILSVFLFDANLYAFQEQPIESQSGFLGRMGEKIGTSFEDSIAGLVTLVVGSMGTMLVAFLKRKMENSGKADMESLIQQMPDEMLAKMTPQDFINLIKATK